MCTSNDTACKSMLHILRSASVDFPLLRRLLKHLYNVYNDGEEDDPFRIPNCTVFSVFRCY